MTHNTNRPYGVHEVWQIKGTEKDDEMNFLARIYEKKAKKMYRPSRVRYIFSSYKNLKKI